VADLLRQPPSSGFAPTSSFLIVGRSVRGGRWRHQADRDIKGLRDLDWSGNGRATHIYERRIRVRPIAPITDRRRLSKAIAAGLQI
jgi:hypothetical protein